MGTASFQHNTALRIDGKTFLMLRKVSEDLWQLEETKTKRIHERTDRELRALYAAGTLEFDRAEDMAVDAKGLKIGKPNLHVPEGLMEEAKVCRIYGLEAMNVPATEAALKAVAKATWEKLKRPARIPHWITVYRWRKKLINSGRDIHAVVRKVGKRGNRQRRYPQEVLTLVDEAIDLIFLTRERRTMQDVLDKVKNDVIRENKLRPTEAQLPEPTYRLVKSMINALPAFDRCLAREGRDVALRRFRSMLGHRTTEAPLQRAEIDHTLMDLMVIDDDSGLPLGRPVLSACIDDYTRCALGINIGFEPPSFLTVARCLKNAFMPKTNLNALYSEIINDWDAHGVMRELSMDNGAEFHSNSLEEACYSLGIEIHYSPRKTPWFKGKIERFQGTLNREVAHVAPGTTFSNIFDKEDYDPVKHAVVRLSTLQHIVRKWIVDVYHQRPHRTLKVPPATLWKSSINLEDIQLPEAPERLDAILGRREQRVLTHKGIEFEGLFYNSPDMTTLRMQLGERLDVEICVDDGDIGKVVVLSPDKKRMFVVPALAQTYAKGITAWQHKVCKRYAAKEMAKYDSAAWLQAKERIAEMIRNEMALKKSRTKTNSRAARYAEGTKQPPTSAAAPAVPKDTPPAVALPLLSAAPTSAPAPDATHLSLPPRRFAPLVRQRTQNFEDPNA